MNNIITDEDIFNFIINRSMLSSEKLQYLELNRSIYQKEIDMCKELFSEPNDEITEIASSIIDKVKSIHIVELLPQIISQPETTGIKLAAANSAELVIKNASSSYCDVDSKYLVRIVRYESYSQMYVFAKEKKTNILSVKLFPSENVYSVTDYNKPIEILTEQKIDKIIVQEK